MVSPISVENAILEERLKVCEEFLDATEQLEQALVRDDMTVISRLITKRLALMERIERLDRRDGIQKRSEPPPRQESGRRVSGLSDRIIRTLERIRSVNRVCEDLADRRCEALRSEVGVMRQREAGRHRYPYKAQEPSRFLNLKT